MKNKTKNKNAQCQLCEVCEVKEEPMVKRIRGTNNL